MVKADMFFGVAKNVTDMGLSRQTSGRFFLQNHGGGANAWVSWEKKTNFT